MEQNVLSVTELNNRIKGLLDADPVLQFICVQGELSNYKIYPSGHHYFTLKDSESSIRCVMFKRSAMKLQFSPESGIGVVAFGQVSVYSRDGVYQLYVSGMLPQGTGQLYAEFEQLKKKLAAEGLFNAEIKKPIPRFPKKIAVITSGAGAAVQDIIRVTGKRWPLAKIIVLPVRVQGTEAPMQIVGALRYANLWKVADVIICGRGGGSMEDLWAFNDERVARAIWESGIPVISAVGHEPDITIADFVADLRAATPSNGAELAVPDVTEIRDALKSSYNRCIQAIKQTLETRRKTLEDLASSKVMQSPTGYIDVKRMALDMEQNRLLAAQERIVHEHKHSFVRLTAALDAMSPLKVLSRGYAVVSDRSGKVIRRSADVEIDEQIQVCLSEGGLVCRVEERREQKEND